MDKPWEMHKIHTITNTEVKNTTLPLLQVVSYIPAMMQKPISSSPTQLHNYPQIVHMLQISYTAL